MKVIDKLIIILVLNSILITNQKNAYRFTLPYDIGWPSKLEFDQLKNSLPGKVFLKGDKGYNPRTWNIRTNVPKPAVIVTPTQTEDVISAVLFAKKYNIRISVLSTGYHQDVRNIYDNAVHLDMYQMNFKSIDIQNRTITMGTGNSWGEIHNYVEAQTNGTLVALSGSDKGFGPYGWVTGGGHGPFTRLYGLGVDTLLNVELLISNGTIINVNENENKDLFRSLRGGAGPAFGISISLKFKLFNSPGKLYAFTGYYALNDETATNFGNFIANATNEVHAYYIPTNYDIPAIPNVQISVRCFSLNGIDCTKILNEMINKNCVTVIQGEHCSIKSYTNFYDFLQYQTTDSGKIPIYIYGTMLNASNIVQALKDTNSFISKNKNMMCSGNAVLGGVSATIDPNGENTSVPPALRTSIMSLSCGAALFADNTVEERKARIKTLDDFGENILKNYSKYVYWNEPIHNFPQNDWKERYWGSLDNYNKLLEVKFKFDPNNTFTCYHCIGYDNSSGIDPAVCPKFDCTCSNNPDGSCNSADLKFRNILYLVIFLLIAVLI